VLLFPYYTTRADNAGNAFSTLVSVVNATPLAKAVRVRFLEGKHSRTVLNFTLFLSPFDMWTAAILPDLDNGGARIGTVDTSCTLPAFAASPTAPFIRFGNEGYTGVNADGAGTSLDRNREGFFEVIEMATFNASSPTGRAVTHVNGVPPCGAGGLSDTQAAADALPLTGGLFGGETFINVSSGTDYTADAVALANFYQVGANYFSFDSTLPELSGASPPLSKVDAVNGAVYQSLWSQGAADAVSAVLMHDSLMNEFVLDTATRSGTDWVVTMPTKRFYVPDGTGNAPTLFQRNFSSASGSCDDITLTLWDREERPAGALAFAPPAPTGGNALCWAANVITFNQSNVLGSQNAANIPVPSFQNGWLSVGFPAGIAGAGLTAHKMINANFTSITAQGGATTFSNTSTYVGLPVIGFALISFANGTLQVGTPPVNVLSNYGGDFRHKTNTTIQ